MKKLLTPMLTAALGWVSASALADADLKPIPEDIQYCSVCHGTQLRGNPGTGAPRLSGLPAWYVEAQLQGFLHEYRGTEEQDYPGNEMRVAAHGVTDMNLAKVAQWVADTQSPEPTASISGNISHGKELYGSCVSCHGVDAGGNKALHAPPLAGSSDWYLLRQLKNFNSGRRGTAEGDTYGQQMRASAALLTSDQDMIDVVSYIQSLSKTQ